MVPDLHSVHVCVMEETWGEIWSPFTVHCHHGAQRSFSNCFYEPKKGEIE